MLLLSHSWAALWPTGPKVGHSLLAITLVRSTEVMRKLISSQRPIGRELLAPDYFLDHSAALRPPRR